MVQFVERRWAEGREWMLDRPPEAMEATLEHLDRRYGGAESYVPEIGLADEALDAIRSGSGGVGEVSESVRATS